MSYSVPYSFTPGTKARAQEVNANFNAVTDYFETLDSAKANLNLSNISSQGIDVIKNNSSIRNIGEIILSPVPLSDSGLHLLDGSLINDDGIYKDFVKYIKNLYNNDSTSNYFTTESLWQSSVTSYGVCGKFVYTPASENDTATVRLPRVTGIIEGTIETSELGDLIEAGLPNITGRIGVIGANTESGSGCLYSDGGGASAATAGAGSTSYFGLDASRSNSIYGNSQTVQPQTVKMLYYIVIASTAKTDIQVDIDEIATDLNNKMDTDLTNMTASQSSKNTIIGWGTPDYTNGITLSASSFPYTAPCAGYIYVLWYCSSYGGASLLVDGNVADYTRNAFGGNLNLTVRAFVPKSSIVSLTGNDSIFDSSTFYPLKGAN